MNAPQRPRPVGPGAQLRGKLVEEVANTASDNVIDGDPINARRAAVGTDLAPSLPEHVAAGDLVIEGVETAIPVLLGTEVSARDSSTAAKGGSRPLVACRTSVDAITRVPAD